MQTWLVLVAAVINLLLGLYVLIANPRKLIYLTFFAFTFVTSLWVFFSFLFVYLGFDNLLLYRLQFTTGAIAVPFGILWFETFIGKRTKKRWAIAILAIGFVWSAIATFTGLLAPSVAGTVVADKGWLFHLFSYDLEFPKGALADIYGIFVLLVVVYFFFRLTSEIRKAEGAQRTQLNYIAAGLTTFGLVVILVNVVSPIVYGVSTMVFADTISTLVFTSMSAVAIIKHQFMDIRLAASRSFAYTVLIGGFAITYGTLSIVFEMLFLSRTIITDYNTYLIRVGLAVVMAIGFSPVKKKIDKFTERLFYRNDYDPQTLLKYFSDEIGKEDTMSATIQKALGIIADEMKIKKASVIVTDGSNLVFTQPQEELGFEDEDVNKLATADGVQYRANLREDDEIDKLLKKYDMEASIPLKTGNNSYGILFLGEKLSGNFYSRRDLNTISTLASVLAVNLELWLKVEKTLHELEAANETLEGLDRAKTEFIALISHNLRTPLTTVEGYMSFLLELSNYKDAKNVSSYLNSMNIGVVRLSNLVEDIILITSILSNKKQILINNVSLDGVIEHVKSKFQTEISTKKLDFKIELSEETIRSDSELLEIVFSNLIDNAIKFNREGGSVTISNKRLNDKEVIFNFIDTGTGISTDKQNGIFGKFTHQTENIYRYDHEGMGLGLYTTKLIIDLLGGSIRYESLKEGSNLIVKIPSKNSKVDDEKHAKKEVETNDGKN